MFALQDIACAAVVEFLEGYIPVNDGKAPAVVLRVTGDARSSAPVVTDQRRMQAARLVQPGADLLVAVEAFVFRGALGEVVAIRAVRCAVKRAVGLGHDSGGDLGNRIAFAKCETETNRHCQPGKPSHDQHLLL